MEDGLRNRESVARIHFALLIFLLFQIASAPLHAQLSDQFESAVDLGSAPAFLIEQFSAGATVQLGESQNQAPGWETLWGNWTAPYDGLFVLKQIGPIGPAAAVYEGDSRSHFRPLASGRSPIYVDRNPGPEANLLRFQAVAGTTVPKTRWRSRRAVTTTPNATAIGASSTSCGKSTTSSTPLSTSAARKI